MNIFVFSFQDINPMQIVLLAVFMGICMLGLQKQANQVAGFINQCNVILQHAMGLITAWIHVYVFFCVLQLLLSDQVRTILGAYQFFLYFIGACAILCLFGLIQIWWKTKVSPGIILSKMLPTFLIGVTTNASAAAFTTNMRTCKEEYGIDAKLVDFAIPFGQVIYMPSFSLFMVIFSFFLYDVYAMPISWSVVLMIFVVSIILSIATPPITGAGPAILSILFLQLGLPEAGLGLAIIFDVMTAPLGTALDLVGLQVETICVANDLNLLEKERLRSKRH